CTWLFIPTSSSRRGFRTGRSTCACRSSSCSSAGRGGRRASKRSSMAKFPTEVESSVVAKVPLERTYAFFWDVVGSSTCICGLASCAPAGEATFRFVYEPRSTGPVSLVVQYTSRYSGNGRDEIRFSSIAAAGDNTEVEGSIRLASAGEG